MPTRTFDWMYPTLADVCKLLETPMPEPEPEEPDFDEEED